MKTTLFMLFFLFTNKIFVQTHDESTILNLSASIFRWEVENKFDSLENVLHKKFIAVTSSGSIQDKSQYIARLESGNFIHNNIDIEENKATVSDNTATLIGKGKFTVTVSGQKNTTHLSYMEVFTRSNKDVPWKVLAIKANVLEK